MSRLLRESYGEARGALVSHRGVLDKFIGDAVMALFGVPFNGEHDADDAVRVANAMFVALRELNVERRRDGNTYLVMVDPKAFTFKVGSKAAYVYDPEVITDDDENGGGDIDLLHPFLLGAIPEAPRRALPLSARQGCRRSGTGRRVPRWRDRLSP